MCRLGLAHIFLELLEILITTEVHVQNKKQANGAGRVRELIDQRFQAYDDWVLSKSGDIDWLKRLRFNETIVSRMGVEVQVSGRSDLLARDIVHIRNNLQDSHIDVGVIVVPSDDGCGKSKTGYFLAKQRHMEAVNRFRMLAGLSIPEE